jgi:hypothetical protein
VPCSFSFLTSTVYHLRSLTAMPLPVDPLVGHAAINLAIKP